MPVAMNELLIVKNNPFHLIHQTKGIVHVLGQPSAFSDAPFQLFQLLFIFFG